MLMVSLVGLLVVAFASQASAAPVSVVGQNSQFDSRAGQLYIPLQAATSGPLGLSVGVGKKAGLNPDVIELDQGEGSIGSISWAFNFALSKPIDPNSPAVFSLNTRDLDLLEFVGYGVKYREEVQLVLGTHTITLDGSNYLTYRKPGTGTATNNVAATYSFDLLNHFGLSLGELAAINSSGEFDITVTLLSYVERTALGTERYRNSVETFSNVFTYTAGAINPPEPASMLLLAAGAGLLIRRRARR
jgi:hypothetical protein